MKYHIDEANNKFAYLQLYEQLRKDIVQKVLLYGNKLPSKRLLAEETGTSVITVEHAYSILCEEGYIESRERSGYLQNDRCNKGDLFRKVGRFQWIPKWPITQPLSLRLFNNYEF